MIIDEYVNIKWHPKTKNYFVERGYVFTKMNDVFSVNVNDLRNGSKIIVKVKCDVCGTEKKLRYFVYLNNIKSGGYYGCSNKCSINKYYNTNIEKYGVKYATELEEFKEKRKETCRKKYGVEYAQSLKQFVDKRKETCKERYGIEFPQSLEQFISKRENTNIERYGTKFPQNLDIFIEKKKQTNLKKYGVEYPHQNKKISEMAQNTMIKRYGEIYTKYTPKYNIYSIMFFDLISEKLSINIQHALNGGEKKFVRFFIDGYIEEYNICIEWDEKHHDVKNFKEKDMEREMFLKENYNCEIVRINEKEFLKDIENQIENTCNIINDLIQIIKNKHKK